jgi:hypothetical protein
MTDWKQWAQAHEILQELSFADTIVIYGWG